MEKSSFYHSVEEIYYANFESRSSDEAKSGPLTSFLEHEKIEKAINGGQFDQSSQIYVSSSSSNLGSFELKDSVDSFLVELSEKNGQAYDRLVELAKAIHFGDHLGALKEIAGLVHNKESASVLIAALKNEYNFLIELSFNIGLNKIWEILNKCSNLDLNERSYYDSGSEVEISENIKKIENSNLGKIEISNKNQIGNVVPRITTNRRCNFEIKEKGIGVKLDDPEALKFLSKFRIIENDRQLDERAIKILALTSSFFVKEDRFIEDLLKTADVSKGFVIKFLDMFASIGYPNGAEQKIFVENCLNRLTSKVSLEGNQLKIQNLIPEIVLKQPKSVNNSTTDWHVWTVEEIADSIILRDASLIQAIKFSHLLTWFRQPLTTPSSISNLEESFNKTKNWIALEILKDYKNEDDRAAVLKKFLDIGKQLLKKNNLHGALQVASAFKLSAVKRIVGDFNLDSTYQLTYERLINLDTFQILEMDGAYVPITKEFWDQLKTIYQKIDWNNDLSFYLSLEEMSTYSFELLNFGKIPSNQPLKSNVVKRAIQFLSNLEDVKEETINEYSALCKRWPRPECKKVDFLFWNASHFAAFLDNPLGLRQLFAKGIFSGEDFKKKFESDYHVIDDLPKDCQCEILEQYLYSKHL